MGAYLCIMSTKLSLRKYAALKGCSEGNVRAAIKAGKIKAGISRGANGKVDGIIVEIANKEWADNYGVHKIKNPEMLARLQGENKELEKKINEKRGKKLGQLTGQPIDDLIGNETDIENITFMEATRRQAVLKAELLKLELEEKDGRLVRIEKVKKSLYLFGNEVKNSIMDVPDRIVDEILACNTRQEASLILKTALNLALNQLANVDKRDFTKAI